MRTTRTTYNSRAQWLGVCHPRDLDWRNLSVGDIAFTLEGLQVSPDDFERVLRQAEAVRSGCTPAALTDAAAGYRIGAAHLDDVGRFSGRPIGVYGDCAVLVWVKTEADVRADQKGRQR